MRGILERTILLFCFFLVVYIVFYKLGKAPLENWDEAWFAEVTKQILRTKEFIVLRWNHEVWLDKPPLYMWMSVFFSSLFGLSEFSVRVTSALSGIIVIMGVVIYAYKQYGILPALLAFSSLALNNVFIYRTRSGNIDVFATLLIFASYFLIISKNKYKYIALGILFGLIYLTKASLVVLPLTIFFFHEVLFARKNIRGNLSEYIKLLIAFVLLAGTWLYLGYSKIGTDFYQYFLFKSDQGVASVDLFQFNANYLSYAYYALQRRFFWVLLIGIVCALFSIRTTKYFLLLSYALALFMVLSFTQRSNNWYLVPLMPFWSILIAYGVQRILKLFRYNILIILLIGILSTYVSYKTFTINILPILDNTSTVKQAQSGKELQRLTSQNDVVIRLDHLYPTAIYYSDRKVLASPAGNTKTGEWWISRENVIKSIQTKKIKWLVGINKDVEVFKTEVGNIPLKFIPVNDEETIIEVI